MSKVFLRCEGALVYSAVAATFLIMVTTSADAISRYVFNQPLAAVYEITGEYLLVAAVFLAAGYTYREGAHIRVTLLVGHLPPKVRLVANYFSQIFSILCVGFLVYATIQQDIHVFISGKTSVGLGYPVWPSYAIAPIGFIFLFLPLVFDLPKVKTEKSALLQEESSSL